MTKRLDLTGQVFGQLTTLKFQGVNRFSQSLWVVRCTCGTEKVVQAQCLRNGRTTSCGCARVERATKMGQANRTHGETHTGAYGSWRAMKRRCLEVQNKDFPRYGGSGITICDRWMDFGNFLADMGRRPPRHEIDRIDPFGNYEPGNCRWVLRTENGKNRRNTRWITISGVRRTLKEWCDITGVAYPTALMRIKRGWSEQDAVLEK